MWPMQTASLDLLEKTKLPPDQARAILKVMEAEFATHRAELATKADLDATKADLRVALREYTHALELKIESLRGELVRWVFVCTFGQTALLAGVIYFVLTYVKR
jgi:hypothetical protein